MQERIGRYISMIHRQVIFLLPLFVILPLFWGLEGVMFAGPISDCAAAVLAILLVVRERGHLHRLEAEKNMEEKA